MSFIPLTKAEKVRLRAPWRQSLIVKVMGGSVGYSYMLKKLKHDMAPIRLDNDYYLVKFHSIMDYEFAKYGDGRAS